MEQDELEKTFTIEMSADVLDCVLNSFNAQKLRIASNIKKATEKGLDREVSEWEKIQAKADAAAQLIRDQADRRGVPAEANEPEEIVDEFAFKRSN